MHESWLGSDPGGYTEASSSSGGCRLALLSAITGPRWLRSSTSGRKFPELVCSPLGSPVAPSPARRPQRWCQCGASQLVVHGRPWPAAPKRMNPGFHFVRAWWIPGFTLFRQASSDGQRDVGGQLPARARPEQHLPCPGAAGHRHAAEPRSRTPAVRVRILGCHLGRVTSILTVLLTGTRSISAARRPVRSSANRLTRPRRSPGAAWPDKRLGLEVYEHSRSG